MGTSFSMFRLKLRCLSLWLVAAACLWLVGKSHALCFQPCRPPQTRRSRGIQRVYGAHPCRYTLQASSSSTLPNDESLQISSDDVDDSSTLLSLQDVERLTRQAIEHRGTDVGYQALQTLGRACQQRVPYDFDANDKSSSSSSSNVRPVRQLVPLEITRQVSQIVKTMEAEGYLSTNLDSVDGLPSFHLNLVSGGKPLFPKQQQEEGEAESDNASSQVLFERRIQQLLDLVEPYIYQDLLPQVQRLSEDHRSNDKELPANKKEKMKVGDVFLRRYGQDSEDARNGISAHYDVFSKITAVIAMDDVAAEGKHGLFTTALSSKSLSATTTIKATSNHKSLRRYFPLSEGDAVMHSWDVLHGVDVLPGMGRTSLIVWFTEESEDVQTGPNGDEMGGGVAYTNVENVSPWLLADIGRIEKDEVTQFVLASALESVKDMDASGSHTRNERSSASSSASCYDAQELYLKSAVQQSAFALSRLGSLCETNAWKRPELQQQAQTLLEATCPEEQLPAPLRQIRVAIEKQQQQNSQEPPNHQTMAWRFWLQAALQGNPQAQLALADDLMAHATVCMEAIAGEQQDDTRLLAAVLFGLAAQQGLDDALERLSRVVGFEMIDKQIETQDEFLNSRVVQTAQAATATIDT